MTSSEKVERAAMASSTGTAIEIHYQSVTYIIIHKNEVNWKDKKID